LRNERADLALEAARCPDEPWLQAYYLPGIECLWTPGSPSLHFPVPTDNEFPWALTKEVCARNAKLTESPACLVAALTVLAKDGIETRLKAARDEDVPDNIPEFLRLSSSDATLYARIVRELNLAMWTDPENHEAVADLRSRVILNPYAQPFGEKGLFRIFAQSASALGFEPFARLSEKLFD
jgi:hypothetical protein